MDNQTKIDSFVSICEIDYGIAIQLLEKNNWDLQQCITQFEKSDSKSKSKSEFESESEFQFKSNKFQDEIRPPTQTIREQLLDSPQIDFIRHEPVFKNSIYNNIDIPDYIQKSSIHQFRDIMKKENKYSVICILSDNMKSINLIRDFLTNDIISDILKNNFITWIKDINMEEGQYISNLYDIHETSETSLPHIIIIESMTNKKIKDITNINEIDDFIIELSDFVESNLENIPNKKTRLITGSVSSSVPESMILPSSTSLSVSIPVAVAAPAPEPAQIFNLEEPSIDNRLAYLIKFTFSNGTNIKRRFLKTNTINIISQYIKSLPEYNDTLSEPKLIISATRLSLNNLLDQTLEELNLDKSCIRVS